MTLSTTPVAGSTTTSPLAARTSPPCQLVPTQARESEPIRASRRPAAMRERGRLGIGRSEYGTDCAIPCAAVSPRAPRTPAGSRSRAVGDRRDLRGGRRTSPSSLSVSRIATGRPAASATNTIPTWTEPTGVVSSLSSPTAGTRARSPPRAPRPIPVAARPATSPSPGFRWPPTPIDQRSWSRASPPARVRRIRNQRSPSRSTRYGMTCLSAGSCSAAARSTKQPSRATASERVVDAVRAHARASRARARSRLAGTTSTRSPGSAISSRRSTSDAPARPRAGPGSASVSASARAPRSRRRGPRGRPAGARRSRRRSWPRSRCPSRRRRARGGSCSPSRRPRAPTPGPSPAAAGPRVPGDGLDEGGRQDQRQVADRGDRAIVLLGAHAQPARAPQAPASASTRAIGRRVVRRTGRAPTAGPANRPASDASKPRRLAAGHRVAADEAQAELGRERDDRGLRAGDVGDDGVRPRAIRRSGPPRSRSSARRGERRRGEDHDVRRRRWRPPGCSRRRR